MRGGGGGGGRASKTVAHLMQAQVETMRKKNAYHKFEEGR